MVPMRKPSRMPFLTQALARQPVLEDESGSAARISPRFSASLNSRKRRKCSSVYCAGGSSNSRSICDGNMRSLGEPQRFENAADARTIFRLGWNERQPPHGFEQAHSAIAAFTGNGFDSK